MNERLATGEVHVHTLALAPVLNAAGRFESLLTAEERTRALSFATDTLRRSYVVSHAFCREILGRYLPGGHQLVIVADDLGKPRVQNCSFAGCGFSLTHSATHVIIAVAASPEVGVDTENERAETDALGIARQFFSAEEAAWLHGLPADQVLRCFTRLWVCKEAFTKAIGLGLQYPIDRCAVSGVQSNAPRYERILNEYGRSSDWALAVWSPARGCHAAVTSRTPRLVVHHQPLPADFAF